MKKERFDRLVDSLDEVKRHVRKAAFRGRVTIVEVGASDNCAVRERSGLTQRQSDAA